MNSTRLEGLITESHRIYRERTEHARIQQEQRNREEHARHQRVKDRIESFIASLADGVSAYAEHDLPSPPLPHCIWFVLVHIDLSFADMVPFYAFLEVNSDEIEFRDWRVPVYELTPEWSADDDDGAFPPTWKIAKGTEYVSHKKFGEAMIAAIAEHRRVHGELEEEARKRNAEEQGKNINAYLNATGSE
jgi:hypothetical protein